MLREVSRMISSDVDRGAPLLNFELFWVAIIYELFDTFYELDGG